MNTIPTISAEPFDLEAISDAVDALGLEPVIELSRRMIDACCKDLDEILGLYDAEAYRVLHALSGAAACCGARELSELAKVKARCLPLEPSDVLEMRRLARDTRHWIENHMAEMLRR